MGTLSCLHMEIDIDEPMSVSRPLNTRYLLVPMATLKLGIIIPELATGKLRGPRGETSFVQDYAIHGTS